MSRTEEQELSRVGTDLDNILRKFGLDPFPTRFVLAPANMVVEMAAYGLPAVFGHWTKGSAYYIQKTQETYGASKIYELVVNTDPSYAFLQNSNRMIDNKLVLAHVLAHADFFKHNSAYKDTNRGMIDTAGLHSEMMRKFAFLHGDLVLEQLLDDALSIEYCIEKKGDSHKWESAQSYIDTERKEFKDKQNQKTRPTSPYDDILELGEKRTPNSIEKPPFPVDNEKNLLRFIALHSRVLEDWQRDALLIVHDLARYFLPQRETKIMNEGWASLWHVRALREYGDQGEIADSEFMDWNILNSRVGSPRDYMNPYHVGYTMLEDIERRYKGLPLIGNDGKAKKEYDFEGNEVDISRHKKHPAFDIFEVRSDIPSDQAFFANYLTPSLIERLKMYTFGNDGRDWVIKSRDPKAVYETTVQSMTNLGMPVLVIPAGGADYNHRGELYIKHLEEKDGLDQDRVRKLMPRLYRLWGKTVHLEATFQEFEQKTVAGPWGFPHKYRSFSSRRLVISCSGEEASDIDIKLVV